ncbi:uncharacterized protein EDB91DRAFT_1108325 [Suillus paluster]|uniref:uncharacterized protein n=1 Tax=Suillus paluster TaxID=48578 RepID=UPI001B873F77|nr:uncharacterized protein EDB91DRAFT_1153449 [Suillus paluster]XP_041181903.1 uncharacterized protein EDB91DRAFT_1108325 [Suillus paluster]KAG1731870.1 hypothetical protein EDB91DRAFT_1153449 [Suillus paluster]KAG1750594.1 hypothetical protein EDB91DRAFT_1108325 [Suillus paluster]
MSDLDQAIEALRAVLQLRPPGHSGRIAALNDLAIKLHERSQQRSVLSDLDEAIGLHRSVPLLRRPGHPERIPTLNDLAILIHESFQK